MTQGQSAASAAGTYHWLYTACDDDGALMAALGIAINAEVFGTCVCRWALLLLHQPSSVCQMELTGLSGTTRRMRILALLQAAQEACNQGEFITAGDFHPAPWATLHGLVLERTVRREAVAVMVRHLGNLEDFRWLKASGRARSPRGQAG